MIKQYPKWTEEQDRTVMSMEPQHAARLLPHRSLAAVKQRRHKLRHPPAKPQYPGAKWTGQEIKTLKQQFPVIEHVRDMTSLLPRFTFEQIKCRARRIGLKRKYVGNNFVRVTGHLELIDQVRRRAKDDGFTFKQLDAALKIGRYFGSYKNTRATANLGHIAKAVSFFGGTLVIDWQDR